MKKLICVFLCMTLLTACGGNEPLIADGNPGTPEITATPPPPPEPLSEFEQRLASLDSFEPRTEILRRYHPYPAYELIPGDYGRLYPFPAYGKDSWSTLYGLMTEDGRIVVDGIFSSVQFHDTDGGYYYTYRMVPTGDDVDFGYAESLLITADGSKTLDMTDYWSFRLLGGGKVRVWSSDWDEETREWRGFFTGVIDIDGNILTPVVNPDEHYLRFETDAGVVIYVCPYSGEYISEWTWLYFDSVSITEDGELSAYVKYEPGMMFSSYFISDGTLYELNENLFLTQCAQSRRFILKDSGMNVVKTLGTRVNVSGKLIHDWDWGGGEIYDFDLNLIEGYNDIAAYFGDDIYMLTPVSGSVHHIVDFSDGRSIPAAMNNSHSHYMLSRDEFVVGGMLYNMNGESRRLFPEESWFHHSPGNDFVIVHALSENKQWYHQGLYALTGEELLPPVYERLSYLGDGLFEAVTLSKYMGVINHNGEWLIKTDMLKFMD
jgi:hypothetical protein